jgi:cbb3-type cytochrome oxidase subunit 1
MKGLPFAFLIAGAISVTIGMVWGIQMSATHDHTLAPAHAHLNLLGWVSFSIFAFFYHLVPHAAEGYLPKAHFAVAVTGLIILVPGIALAIQGNGEMLAKIGSVLSLASMLLFVWVVLRAGRQRRASAKMKIA